MFGFISDLAKAAVAVVAVPVAVVVDTAETIGLVEDSGKNHTLNTLGAVGKNIQNALTPDLK